MSDESDKAPKFSPYGWVVSPKDIPSALDNPGLILDYLDEAVEPLLFSDDVKRAAADLLHLVTTVRQADTDFRAGNREDSYRKALFAMYQVGVAAASLEHEQQWPASLKDEAIQALQQANKQKLRYLKNIRGKQLWAEVARETACDYARTLWQRDTDKRIRTGEMTEMVWAWMAEHERLKDLMPETREGLKAWLRSVAAEFPHATKRGRPASK